MPAQDGRRTDREDATKVSSVNNGQLYLEDAARQERVGQLRDEAMPWAALAREATVAYRLHAVRVIQRIVTTAWRNGPCQLEVRAPSV